MYALLWKLICSLLTRRSNLRMGDMGENGVCGDGADEGDVSDDGQWHHSLHL